MSSITASGLGARNARISGRSFFEMNFVKDKMEKTRIALVAEYTVIEIQSGIVGPSIRLSPRMEKLQRTARPNKRATHAEAHAAR